MFLFIWGEVLINFLKWTDNIFKIRKKYTTKNFSFALTTELTVKSSHVKNYENVYSYIKSTTIYFLESLILFQILQPKAISIIISDDKKL